MSRDRHRRVWPAALYDLILRAYPTAYRVRFADEMRRTFLIDYAHVRRRGLVRTAVFWTVTLAQGLWFGLRERLADAIEVSSVQNLSTALKLLRSPREIPAMALALAVGVGLMVAAYGLIHAVLLTPLPYAEPERLVRIWQSAEDTSGPQSLRYPAVEILARTDAPFQGLFAYAASTGWLGRDGARLRSHVEGATVSIDMFDVLGVRAARGRTFSRQDRESTAMPPIVVSERLVRRGFVTGVPGDTIEFDGVRHRVIGVMPEQFWFPDRDADYWLPILAPVNQLLGKGDAAMFRAPVIARMAPGISPVEAAARATALLARPAASEERLRVEPYASLLTAPVKPALLALQAASALVLILVTLNVGWLFVARVRRLRVAFATMRALGASSSRLLGTHFATASLIGALATPAAVMLAWLLLRVGLTLDGGVFSRIAAPAVGGHVVVVAAAAAVIASFVSSLPAALAVVRWKGALAASSRAVTRARVVERAAVVVQIALVFAIGAQAFVFADVLQRLVRANVGFTTTDLAVVAVERRGSATFDSASELARYKHVLSLLEQRGIRAALTNTFPLTGSDSQRVFGRRVSREAQRGPTRARVVTASYFAVTGLRPTAGRVLTAVDAGSRHAVVTGTAAAYRGDTRRIGQTVGIDSGWTIVGVVPPVRQRDFYEPLLPEAYLLYDDFVAAEPEAAAAALSRTFVVVDTTSGGKQALEITRAVLASEMPDVDLRSAAHLGELINARLGPRRLVAAGAITVAIVALLLAAFGIHGMVSHGLMASAREIGIRLALGATPSRIAAESVFPLVGVFIVGVTLGSATLVFAQSTLAAVIVPPPGLTYPSTGVVASAVALALLAALVAACYRPIRAAAGTNPAISLNLE